MGWMSEDETPGYKATSWNEREDDFASVAFWYQTGVPTFAGRAPGAGERRLPSLARMTVKAWDPGTPRKHGPGEVARSTDALTGEDILVYRPSRPVGAWLEIPIDVETKEPLRLEVGAVLLPDGGLYQAYLDGVKIGRPLDFHADAPGDAAFPLLDFWPEPGAHVLRLECVGRNGRSAGRACGVASVRLLERRPRVAEYGHDRDKDWRTDPVLYD